MTEPDSGPQNFENLRNQVRPPGPVLDIHVHPMGDWSPQRALSAREDSELLLAAARRSGVACFCLSSLGPGYPLEPDMALCRKANDYALAMRDQAPQAIFPFCYVIPTDPGEAVKEIRRCVVKNKMVGIKLWISQKASSPVLDPILDCAEEYDVPVLQHAWLKTTGNLPEESTPQDVADLARRHPGARIIMAHLNGANPRGLEAIVDTPNVVVDTSGGDPESGMVELAAARLGARRVVFGSDAPGRHFGVSLAKVLAAALSPADKANILWNNAARLLPGWLDLKPVEGQP